MASSGVVEPTSLTRLADVERRRTQDLVLQLREHCDVNEDQFVLVAATPYRADPVCQLKYYEVVMEGRWFGEQLQSLDCRLL